ncbi:hypothetical protein [Peribacillus glennii]|uniref:hypothetical protein n=1 Tax=Peribacillus glennii TaxID=2303991 RepID=UPI001314DDED|nr:hypothetical protein [Peribacillus glennii]
MKRLWLGQKQSTEKFAKDVYLLLQIKNVLNVVMTIYGNSFLMFKLEEKIKSIK